MEKISKEQKIAMLKDSIKQAIEDYKSRTTFDYHLDNILSKFVKKLAEDSYESKKELRELFRKSPVWNEELDAIVINGTRTSNTNYNIVNDLAIRMLYNKVEANERFSYSDILDIVEFFSDPDRGRDKKIEVINRLVPGAYKEGKKPSRIFRDICKHFGVADETKGSEFQRLYAQFADELSSKKIDFKLYVSLNPAHFITMSNPKSDIKVDTLTSCHSFNSNEYEYVAGCTGYARDKVSFIVFTASDDKDPQTLNNRKTTRQIFAYEPGGNTLLQSRMYNTSGGVNGATEESKLYRDLIQRELSLLENKPNLWVTKNAVNDCEVNEHIKCNCNFGGYPDWKYEEFHPKVSFRKSEEPTTLEIGTSGLCITCGDLTTKHLYCEYCISEYDDDYCRCEECGETHLTDNLFLVTNEEGREILVCEYCLGDNYRSCSACNEHFHNDIILTCRDGYDDEIYMCQDCLENNPYVKCSDCDDLVHIDDTYDIYDENGFQRSVCKYCMESYDFCHNCQEYIDNPIRTETEDGSVTYTCPSCGGEL